MLFNPQYTQALNSVLFRNQNEENSIYKIYEYGVTDFWFLFHISCHIMKFKIISKTLLTSYSCNK